MATIELVTLIFAPRQRCFDLSRSIDLHVASTAGALCCPDRDMASGR